ncbi:hypothetical protein MARPO_0086s0029 [Marchantia polymorpha]|nr:hypothetical protein MARPO_0086s0029 [Marchantia polymorpha]|eukprot:PTQ33702.1 hypothetical protein MARPO_0086s0029 [Marchantia polymorpha]
MCTKNRDRARARTADRIISSRCRRGITQGLDCSSVDSAFPRLNVCDVVSVNPNIEHEVDVNERETLMIDDQDLGFFANFLGICIFVLVVAYHYVVADPKFDTQ